MLQPLLDLVVALGLEGVPGAVYGTTAREADDGVRDLQRHFAMTTRPRLCRAPSALDEHAPTPRSSVRVYELVTGLEPVALFAESS